MDEKQLEELKRVTEQVDEPDEEELKKDEEQDESTEDESKDDDSKTDDTSEDQEEEQDEDDSEEEQPPVSRRESKRIAQLLERLKDKESDEPKGEPKRTKKQIIDEGDYDLEQINKIAEEYADERFNEGLSVSKQQANAILFSTRLELDVPKVTSKYSFLDKESDDFDAGRADFIDQLFLKTVGYNPKTQTVQNSNIRYNEFVEGIMDLVEQETSVKSAETATNIAKQQAKTGVRPGGNTKKSYTGSNPTKMSDSQLDEAISSLLSGTRR